MTKIKILKNKIIFPIPESSYQKIVGEIDCVLRLIKEKYQEIKIWSYGNGKVTVELSKSTTKRISKFFESTRCYFCGKKCDDRWGSYSLSQVLIGKSTLEFVRLCKNCFGRLARFVEKINVKGGKS